MAWRTSGEASDAICTMEIAAVLVGSGALAHRSATGKKRGRGMCKFALMLSPCRESSLIWNFSVPYARYGGATQCLFKTFCGIRPFARVNLPLPGHTGCGMECWPEGVGRTIHGSQFPQPALTRSSLELALQATSILSRSLETASKRHGAGHRRHETSVSWLPGTDSAAPAPLACRWIW